ncbi:MAG TPA: SusC/RagA family TonB-linked outer membrane protein, partial [Niabella sp.]|nr:SusC/RagA family TonB-linked outer membrane protein [Niabella sp.]
MAQTKTVTGTVVDDSTQAPISGVTITVKNAPQSAVTNQDGVFTLNVPTGGAVLEYSHIGYELGAITVSGDGPLLIKMTKLSTSLDEVVVVGYGTQKKSHLTGSIESIKAAEVQDLPTGNLGAALAGRVLGLSVSGGISRPGVQPTLLLRNPESISKDGGTTTPLIVIDGVIQVTSQGLNDATMFNNLDPTEVETISFLKDGAAAIYGSRAANGAIIVTTKRGAIGKPRITYNGSYGWNEEAYRTKMMSAYELARYINIVNGPNGANITNKDDRTRFFSQDELDHFKTVNHDWVDQAWKKAQNTRHTVNLSGGADRATYFGSISYFNQNGNLGSMDYDRWTYRAGTDAIVATGLKVGLQVAGVLTDNKKVFSKIGGENVENDYRMMLMAPRYVPTSIDGRPAKMPGSTSSNNISGYHFFELDDNNNYTKEDQSTSTINFYAEYEPNFLKGLKLRGSYARNTDFSRYERLGSRYMLYRFNLSGENQHIYEGATVRDSAYYTNDNRLGFSTTRSKLTQANFVMSYNKQIGLHEISALFSAERSETETTQEDVSRENPYPGSNGQILTGASGTIDGRSFKYEGGNLGYIGRLNYAYNSKYLAEFLFRTDASTKFAPENYWGRFYSLSAGWVISKES